LADNGLLVRPADARVLYVLGPGAGGGMRQRFLEEIAQALGAAGVATYRYEIGSTNNNVAERRVREAVGDAAAQTPGLPLIAGGKSFGGRMTSQAQAREPLAGVRGLVFLGFPLHPPGKPGTERAAHLPKIRIPMLFLQGTRDQFAMIELLQPVVAGLGDRATLHLIEEGDHSFKVPKRSGRSEKDVMGELAHTIAAWWWPAAFL
jgi:predicted alpha/beta-hydrolase family hydrolase